MLLGEEKSWSGEPGPAWETHLTLGVLGHLRPQFPHGQIGVDVSGAGMWMGPGWAGVRGEIRQGPSCRYCLALWTDVEWAKGLDLKSHSTKPQIGRRKRTSRASMIGAGPPERKDGSVDVPGTQCRGAWGTQAEMQRNGDVRVGPHGHK